METSDELEDTVEDKNLEIYIQSCTPQPLKYKHQKCKHQKMPKKKFQQIHQPR